MANNFSNLSTTLVATAPSPASSGTSLVVTASEGAILPATPFYATVAPDGQLPTFDNAEIVQVTNVSTDTLTIVRAQKGTTAKSIAIGWRLTAAIYAEDLDGYQAPVGAVISYAGSTAPDGWLLCYGQAVSRTTYADLFDIIGTTYGSGDGSSTFNLPDLRGRVTAGKDNMGGVSADRLTDQTGGLDGDVLGDTGGTETHTLTSSEMPSHTHGAGTLATASNGAHTHTPSAARTTGAGSNLTGTGVPPHNGVPSGNSWTGSIDSQGTHSHTVSGNTGSAGSDGAHNNVQPTIILNYIIKAKAPVTTPQSDVDSAIQAMYPIGSIYINATSSTNPATLLGFGTWTAFGAGRVMVGLDSGDTDFDTAEETGGSKTVNLSHNHGGATTGNANGTSYLVPNGAVYELASLVHTHNISSSLSSTQTIVQPYVVVYMWKRTA